MLEMLKLAHLSLSDVSMVVAGGAAYNYNLSTDIDIFVLNSTKMLEKASYGSFLAQKIINWLAINGIFGVKCTCGLDLGEYPGSSGIKDMHTLSGPMLVKPIQLICHTAPTVEALLDGFDLTTHMVAMDALGTITLGTYWTAEPLIHVTHNLDLTKTTQRLQKLRERYGYGPLDKGEVLYAPFKPLSPSSVSGSVAEQFNKDYDEKWTKMHTQPLPIQTPFLAGKTGSSSAIYGTKKATENLCFEANTDDE